MCSVDNENWYKILREVRLKEKVMSRSINLDSFYDLIMDFGNNKIVLQNFINSLYEYNDQTCKVRVDLNELKAFCFLYNIINSKLNDEQKSGWFYNSLNKSAINQEFDLLRFSENTIINIELKSQDGNLDDWKNQLVRENKVLKAISGYKIHNYLFESKNRILYKLVLKNNMPENDFYSYEIVKYGFDDFANEIPNDFLDYNKLLSIKPSDLLISPYNQTDAYINGLTYPSNNQRYVYNTVIKNNKRVNLINGGAGSGKSLVLFELAKHYTRRALRVAIVFCGILKNSKTISSKFDFDVLSISDVNSIGLKSLENYDVVLFDEFQRVRFNQYNEIINLNINKMIFSLDQEQTLHDGEIERDIESKLIEHYGERPLTIENKIRQDAEMSTFILKFLNAKTPKLRPYNFKNVNVTYFSNKNRAMKYLDYKRSIENFTIIQLTEYRTTGGFLQREKIQVESENSHSVVGKEYDNVIVVFDNNISYDKKTAKLISNYRKTTDYKNYPYDEYSLYFEALTRVRDKLELVVINNEEIYLRILEILNWRKDNPYELKNKIEQLQAENKQLQEEIDKLKTK